MDVRFHCSKRVRNSGKKSKHRVLETCPTVLQVLRLNPEYGEVIRKTGGLRKMRLIAPGLNVGKSGGYRLIYRSKAMDEALHIVFLEIYFKGDCEDLSKDHYGTLEDDADAIFNMPILHDWE